MLGREVPTESKSHIHQQVDKHKTMATHNCVILTMDKTLEQKLDFYVREVRTGIPSRIRSDRLFLTFHGNPVTSSHVTSTLDKFGGACTTKIRKFIVTMVRLGRKVPKF